MSLVYQVRCRYCGNDDYEGQRRCHKCRAAYGDVEYLVKTQRDGHWDWDHFADTEAEASFSQREAALALKYDLIHNSSPNWQQEDVATFVVSANRDHEFFRLFVFKSSSEAHDAVHETLKVSDVRKLLWTWAQSGAYIPQVLVQKSFREGCGRRVKCTRPIGRFLVQKGQVHEVPL